MRLVNWGLGLLILCAVTIGDSFASSQSVLGRDGSELGNSFIPYDSKIGDYSLEYSRLWRFNDLSQTASFSDANADPQKGVSFLSVHVDRTGGPATLNELRERLELNQAGVAWEPISLGGASGLRGAKDGVTQLYLLRAPHDLLSLRFRSTDGARTDTVIEHMLKSFRAE